MNTPKVAVLMATYNGARFVEAQVKSLKENRTPFTLHWLDDHSNDDTRAAVRTAAVQADIPLAEYHQDGHLGVPRAFFQLMEDAEADIYLFCDQDDIWQPGKIDAMVDNLLPDLAEPVLCFVDVLVFKDGNPEVFRPLSDLIGTSRATTLREQKVFVFNRVMGNTVGFTRPLRELFLKHKDIANAQAVMHDWWMHLIAIASGTRRTLSDVPTTLWRLHGNNTAGVYFDLFRWRGIIPSARMWNLQQTMRRFSAQQARAFCTAAETLPPSSKLTRLLEIARMIATVDRRQSLVGVLRLALRGALPPIGGWIIWFTAACLYSDASSPRSSA